MRPKTFARRLAIQAMYQWSINDTELTDLITQFQEYDTWKKADATWFYQLIKGTITDVTALDELISSVSNRKLSKIDLIELAILRLGVFELQHRLEVPYKVVLNEYINLAKVFGSDKSHSFINASLDKLSKTSRSLERGIAIS